MKKILTLFDDQRLTLEEAIELSLASLREYGKRYKHWVLCYSGGKDSSATVTFVAWAIRNGLVPTPESLAVLYADTRQEYPPLHATAIKLMAQLQTEGINTKIVLSPLDHRFYVYMLGYGVPPPRPYFRWCTGILKIQPMTHALEEMRQQHGEKFLLINGVRLGESKVRDERIALSCGKVGECGQGWFQADPPASVGDRLAPIIHWRVCHVFDWLYFESDRHGYPEVNGIASVYGDDDVRTGCIGCNVASDDIALKNLIKHPDWGHLSPLLELRGLFAELIKPKWRLRKAQPEIRAGGKLSTNGQRMGPLTMEGRAYGLAKVLDIQARAQVDLINDEELARIKEMWAQGLYPQKWSEADGRADVPIDKITVIDGGAAMVVQPLLVR